MANRRNRRLPPRAPLRNNPQPTRRQPLLRKLTDSTSLQLQADGDCNYPVQYVDNRPGRDPATMPLSTRTCLPLAGITHTSTMTTTMRVTSSSIKRHIHLRSRQSQTYRAFMTSKLLLVEQERPGRQPQRAKNTPSWSQHSRLVMETGSHPYDTSTCCPPKTSCDQGMEGISLDPCNDSAHKTSRKSPHRADHGGVQHPGELCFT